VHLIENKVFIYKIWVGVHTARAGPLYLRLWGPQRQIFVAGKFSVRNPSPRHYKYSRIALNCGAGAEAMPAFSAEQVASRLAALPGWQVENGELTRTFRFEDFVAALAFVNLVGEQAEKAGHHPDIDIRYNRVRLALVTHDAGGLTARNFDLATDLDPLA